MTGMDRSGLPRSKEREGLAPPGVRGPLDRARLRVVRSTMNAALKLCGYSVRQRAQALRACRSSIEAYDARGDAAPARPRAAAGRSTPTASRAAIPGLTPSEMADILATPTADHPGAPTIADDPEAAAWLAQFLPPPPRD